MRARRCFLAAAIAFAAASPSWGQPASIPDGELSLATRVLARSGDRRKLSWGSLYK